MLRVVARAIVGLLVFRVDCGWRCGAGRCSARAGHWAVTRHLLHNTQVDPMSSNGQLLVHAAEAGHLPVVRLLLQNASRAATEQRSTLPDASLASALHKALVAASAAARVDVVAELVRHGAVPDPAVEKEKEEEKGGALAAAARANAGEVVTFLVERFRDVWIGDPAKLALRAAVEAGAASEHRLTCCRSCCCFVDLLCARGLLCYLCKSSGFWVILGRLMKGWF